MLCIHSEIDVYFTEEVFHASEAELRVPVVVGKNRKIATPLRVQLRPLSIVDILQMFNTSSTAQPSCPKMCSCTCNSIFFGEECGGFITMYLHYGTQLVHPV